jgi:hypothetical protein
MPDLSEILKVRIQSLEETQRAIHRSYAQMDQEIDKEWSELCDFLKAPYRAVKPRVGWNKLEFRARRITIIDDYLPYVQFSLQKRDEAGYVYTAAYVAISLDRDRRYVSPQLRWKFSSSESAVPGGYMKRNNGIWLVQLSNSEVVEISPLIAETFASHLVGLTDSPQWWSDFWKWLSRL